MMFSHTNFIQLRTLLVKFFIFEVALAVCFFLPAVNGFNHEIANLPDFMKLNLDMDFDSKIQEHQRRNLYISQDILEIHNGVTRMLGTLNPDSVCEGYNNATKGLLTCECQNYNGTKAVLINCTYDGDQCNEDQSFCYNGYITTIVEGRDPNITISNVTTSCTNVTTSPTPEFVCIRVFPNENGNYTTIDSCSAQYNGVTCNSCGPCVPANITANGTSLNKTYITVNCCNVLQDKKQTCGSISTNGATIQQFDYVRPGDEGQCKSNSIRRTVFWFATISSFAVSVLFW